NGSGEFSTSSALNRQKACVGRTSRQGLPKGEFVLQDLEPHHWFCCFLPLCEAQYSKPEKSGKYQSWWQAVAFGRADSQIVPQPDRPLAHLLVKMIHKTRARMRPRRKAHFY